MPTTVPGRAKYSAFRLFGVTSVIAVGETPNINDKVDLVQLPFLILPPMFAFVFIKADIALPTVHPFKYEEAIPFPPDANFVRISDADGIHSIPIADVVVPPMEQMFLAKLDGNDFCVFSWVGIGSLLIAKCSADVPAVYARVFGPDTHAACEQYVKDNGGNS